MDHCSGKLVLAILEQFWEHLHPAIADPEDIELRAAPLSWIGQYLVFAVQSAPLNKTGHSYLQYKQGRDIPTEAEAAADNEKKAARESAIKNGKLPPEDFEGGLRVETVRHSMREETHCFSRSGDEPVILNSESLDTIQGVFLFSDGLQTFRDADNNLVPVADVLEQLLAIKSTRGEFLKRRCKKFFGKFCRDNGWHHDDDFSVAGIMR